MPYIGKSPVGGGFHKLDNLTASATATYALTLGSAAYYPETANQLLVSLNGVIQAPQDSFTVSGSNLIFDSALTASDSIDFVVALGDVLGVGSVTDGAVSTNKIANGAVTDAKIDTMAASKLTGALPASVTSSGVYLGGTGSANYLDDYEEGTTSGTLIANSGSFTTATYTGRYRKIGSLINLAFEATITSIGSANFGFVIPLPFQADGNYGYSGSGRRMSDNVQFHTVLSSVNYVVARNTCTGGTLNVNGATYYGSLAYQTN